MFQDIAGPIEGQVAIDSEAEEAELTWFGEVPVRSTNCKMSSSWLSEASAMVVTCLRIDVGCLSKFGSVCKRSSRGERQQK